MTKSIFKTTVAAKKSCYLSDPRSCPYHIFFAILFFDTVNGLVKLDHFLGVIEQVDLVCAGNQVGKADADQAD
jgi:hypothetical protein